MKPATTGLLGRAATARIVCPTQAASRQQHFKDDSHHGSQSRSYICTPQTILWRSRSLDSSLRLARAVPRRAFHATSISLATKDPYKVLGVGPNASTSEVKKAYYGMAKKFHPDTNKDPTAKDNFSEAQSAYELLNDPQKKAAWDQFGAAAFDQGGPGQGPSPGGGGGFGGGNPFAGAGGFGGAGFGGSGGFNFEDLFKGFAGAGRRTQGGRNQYQEEILVGDTIEVQTTITFKEAAKGTSKDISINPSTTCKTCTGTGLKAGVKSTECKTCRGTGERVHVMGGGFHMASTCNACGGSGATVPSGSDCRTCAGNGVTRERKTITVDIPGGIDDGIRISLAQQGDAAATGGSSNPHVRGIPGDLYVRVRVATDPKFGRSGSDILYTATIPLTTALLGGEVTVPTLDNEVNVKVATGTATGDKLTLPGHGMKKLQDRRGRVGDLKVEFKVQMPKYLSSNERVVAEMLADEMGDKTAKRIMNVGRQSSETAEEHKGEGFLKSVWHKLNPGHKAPFDTSSTMKDQSSKEGRDTASDVDASKDVEKKM
ncbi:mitochondrial DnaJ chaperone-like protein [Calycina marina]|uniref:DnaJ homolog 1, mitochondrial n=1 Tax=Calycina marina TaxID=1763456 RepID=A0A9P7ZB64_9HELO|nr:mitochondrial DnaJ chaperone-like protein [Calycina marina]